MMNVNEDYIIYDIDMSEIQHDDEFNCRGKIAPFDVMDLVPDIKARGLDTPILLKRTPEGPKKFKIIAGHRRHAACKMLQWLKIPARIKEKLQPLEENIINLTENLKRQNLNMVQEARGLIAFKKFKWTEAMIAEKVGMSRGWVQVRLMLLDLPLDVQAQAAAGLMNQEAGSSCLHSSGK